MIADYRAGRAIKRERISAEEFQACPACVRGNCRDNKDVNVSGTTSLAQAEKLSF